MQTWKESGEVPDSDDDDFDSQSLSGSAAQSPRNRQSPSPTPARSHRSTGNLDVWGVPVSPPPQQQLEAVQDGTPPSSLADGNADSRASSPLSPPPPSATRNSSTVSQKAELVPDHAPPRPGNPCGQSDSLPQGRRDHRRNGAIPPSTAISPSRQAAVRLERSLRPRKPIQEHPYLLENAQYSKVMKSHGVKPIRVVNENEASRRHRNHEQDSQDQEFSAEDSQLPSIAPEDDSADGESQPVHIPDALDDRDELAPSPSPKTSSQSRALLSSQSGHGEEDHTDNTSLLGDDDDDDELPSLDEMLKQPLRFQRRQPKRRKQPALPLSAKRRKTNQQGSHPATSVERSRAGLVSGPPASPSPPEFRLPRPLTTTPPRRATRPAESPQSSPLAQSSPPRTRPGKQVISRLDDDDDDISEAESNRSSSESDSEAAVRQNVRRIRGVLPASWLRLDLNSRNAAVAKPSPARRSPSPTPQLPKRGVALPRQRVVSPPAASSSLFDIFSDDNDINDSDDNELDENNGEARVDLAVVRKTPGVSGLADQLFNLDGDLSVEEEDSIDMMIPTRKRRRQETAEARSAKHRKKRSSSVLHRSESRLKTRQPKITSVFDVQAFDRDSRATAPRRKPPSGITRAKISSKKSPPPRLSILDVAEPGAPAFIRIASRNAQRAPNQGRTSPSRKQINLGNRKDNIDALSVLRDWRSGSIRPKYRQPTVVAQPKKTSLQQTTLSPADHVRPPLGQRSINLPSAVRPSVPQPNITFGKPKKVASTQPKTGRLLNAAKEPDPLENRNTAPVPSGLRSKASQARHFRSATRPAQLETSEFDRPDKFAFHARKKRLDALYRRSKSSADSSALHLERFIHSTSRTACLKPVAIEKDQGLLPMAAAMVVSVDPADSEAGNQRARSKFRKRYTPRFVDVTKPQFLHAADPLPVEDLAIDTQKDPVEESDKLSGLGPFGTQYTHHFEVFPLDAGVFSHESTLIGQGRLSRAIESPVGERSHVARQRPSFKLGEEMLQWGSWDGTTSSELGILIDFILDRTVAEPQDSVDGQSISPASQTVAAADYLLDCVQDWMSFPDDDSLKSFVLRLAEVLCGFLDRLEEAPQTFNPDQRRIEGTPLVQILPRFILVVFLSLRMSRASPALMEPSFQLEAVLSKLAVFSTKCLVASGHRDLERTYAALQHLAYRERGIKPDRGTFGLWVVLMKVLDAAKTPRAGFWEMLHSAILTPELAASSDLRQLEQAWKSVFILLPLAEFDNSGIVRAGLRHSITWDGWALPQALLKRVFQLCRQNPRQAPSFNDYCRALLGRCHYLVEQWCWQKCTGVLGTIFDFFGAQGLAHLRNEEVYKSPQFLEQLATQPCLSITPEDRCFHIFIKTVALVIQRLRRLGLSKDIGNLVTRILPNHNRQYMKEQTIHQHELAALRNHHDLLCTLFWAAPSDLRPGLHLIEKLVVPGSSHKEACLINVRAWSQIARFVVSSEEGPEPFRPLMSWQSTIFRQTLEQYRSAASDIQQQVLALSKDGGIFSPELVEEMISKNKATAMDVLYCSVQASLEVLKVAPSLTAAMYSLNTYQLAEVFTKFDPSSPDFDWHVLLVALETLEQFLDRLDAAFDRQYSPDSGVDPKQAREAVMLLEHSLAVGLFSIAGSLLDRLEPKDVPMQVGSRASLCTEKAVTVSSRVASRFVQERITSLPTFFNHGKYGLFRKMPKHQSLARRRFLPLFLATLAKSNVLDFKDLGVSSRKDPFEMWMLSIISPSPALEYVCRLGEALQLHNLPFMAGATMPPATPPPQLRYEWARDLFANGIAWMRSSLRGTSASGSTGVGGGTQRQVSQQSRAEFGRILQSVMDQTKHDLASLRPDRQEHLAFVGLVHQIIGLIKSHGGDICPVDQFFYQVSAEYAPSPQDPQLHLAGILAYGIRLGEGESTAIPQLFSYLHNSFKVAVSNDRLGGEANILARCMDNANIFAFMVGRMLPALVRAVAQTSEAWPLVEVYSGALQRLLTRSCVPKEVGVEQADDVLTLLLAVLSAIQTFHKRLGDGSGLSLAQVYVLVQLASLANLLQPTLTAYSFCFSVDEASAGREQSANLAKAVDAFSSFCETATLELARIRKCSGCHSAVSNIESIEAGCASSALGGIGSYDRKAFGRLAHDSNPHVESFARQVALDVHRSWVVTDRLVSVQSPGRMPTQTTQSSTIGAMGRVQGTPYRPWNVHDLLGRLEDQLRLWSANMAVPADGRRRRHRWRRHQ